jgi:hypothetical protein
MSTPENPALEERLALLDTIVGRCVRDRAFADRVLSDPDEALREYALDEGELDDFRALAASRRDEAIAVWAALRAALEGARR